MKTIRCPFCNAISTGDSEDEMFRCSSCGMAFNIPKNSEEIHAHGEIDFKPRKILPFAIDEYVAKKKVDEFFSKSTFQWKNDLMDKLHPIYLPYLMYECSCNFENYYEVNYRNQRNRKYLEKSEFNCGGILVNVSKNIEDSLLDKLDKTWLLDNIKEFDSSYISDVSVDESDDTSKNVYEIFTKKLEWDVIVRELGFHFLSSDAKLNINQVNTTGIYLPLYYGEIYGLKVIVNGVTGDVAINSNEYLKSEKRLNFEKFLQRPNVKNKTLLFTILCLIVLIATCILIEKISSAFLQLIKACSLVLSIGIIAFLIYYKNRKRVPSNRYTIGIIHREKKKLNIFEEISLATKNKNDPPKKRKSMLIMQIISFLLVIAVVALFMKIICILVMSLENAGNMFADKTFTFIYVVMIVIAVICCILRSINIILDLLFNIFIRK